MHQFGSPNDPTPHHLPQTLMPQANTQDRHCLAKLFDNRERDACFIGCAGAGRNNDAIGLTGSQIGNTDLIVAVNRDLSSQLTQVLHQVVGEAVVVINHGDTRGNRRHGGSLKGANHDPSEHCDTTDAIAGAKHPDERLSAGSASEPRFATVPAAASDGWR